MRQSVEFIEVYCDVCHEMPEIEYRGLTGRTPTLWARCRCGKRVLQIFNRCNRFPDRPPRKN